MSTFCLSGREQFRFSVRLESCKQKQPNKITVYETKYAEKHMTKQNKELPPIPLCTYYDLPYPVTQRLALDISTAFIILICNDFRSANDNYLNMQKQQLYSESSPIKFDVTF